MTQERRKNVEGRGWVVDIDGFLEQQRFFPTHDVREAVAVRQDGDIHVLVEFEDGLVMAVPYEDPETQSVKARVEEEKPNKANGCRRPSPKLFKGSHRLGRKARRSLRKYRARPSFTARTTRRGRPIDLGDS
jgi:hypothetical protein